MKIKITENIESLTRYCAPHCAEALAGMAGLVYGDKHRITISANGYVTILPRKRFEFSNTNPKAKATIHPVNFEILEEEGK